MGAFPFLNESTEREIFKTNPQKINPLNHKRIEMISCSENSVHLLTGFADKILSIINKCSFLDEGIVYAWGNDKEKTGILALGEKTEILSPEIVPGFSEK